MAENNSEPTLWTPGRIIATLVVVALIATLGYTLLSGHPEEKADPKVVLPGTPVSNPSATRIPPDVNIRTVDGRTIKRKRQAIVPTRTLISDALSKDLKKRGFKFVGSTICYAFMQAVGMVNDHNFTCFRYNEVD